MFCVVGPSSSSPLRLWRARAGGSAVSQTTGVVSVEAAVPISLEDAAGDMGSSTGCTEAVRLACIEGGCVEVTVCMGETEFTVVVVLPSSHRTGIAEASPPAALPLLSLCGPRDPFTPVKGQLGAMPKDSLELLGNGSGGGSSSSSGDGGSASEAISSGGGTTIGCGNACAEGAAMLVLSALTGCALADDGAAASRSPSAVEASCMARMDLVLSELDGRPLTELRPGVAGPAEAAK